MMTRAILGALTAALFAGCTESQVPPDGGVETDAGGLTGTDGGPPLADAGLSPDGGVSPDGGRPPDAGVPPTGDGGTPAGFTRGKAGCQAIAVAANADLGGYKVDRYSWSDGECLARSAALVRNDAADPGGTRGGYLRELTWKAGGADRVSRGTGINKWNGWGYVVNHYGGTADTSMNKTGTFRTVFAGAHHALHEFKLRVNPGGPVDVTVQWFFATGRSNPIYAITYDATPAGQNTVTADSRSPYGDFAFEGTVGDIAGIAWGDAYKFVTTGAGPLTVGSAWDYTQTNLVPYVRMWSNAADAEMGAVQTQTYEKQLAGGDYGGGALKSDCWGKTSSTRGAGCIDSGQSMPKSYLWPYQLNQYELPATTNSHRLAWGTSFGAVGQATASAFGRSFPGYPKVSYSVFGVIGQRTTQATQVQVTAVERLTASTLSASEGTVVAAGPIGPARTDDVAFSPAGYSPVFATWEVACAAGRATATLDPKGAAVAAPVFRFRGFTAATVSSVVLNGQPVTAGVDYFASVDPAQQTLWLTLNGTVTAPMTVQVR